MTEKPNNFLPLEWPTNRVTEIPFRVFTDEEQYALENERIYKGETWNYLCLEVEVPEPGDYVVSSIGETSIIVTRDHDGELHAMVNRCAHRGALLCLDRCGNADQITCVYHAWSFSLKGELTGVAFEKGVKRQGGMPPDFKKENHNLRTLRVAEFAGLIFGSFSDAAPEIEDYLGPEIASRIKRVLCKPLKVLGRNTQILHNNWKLYVENTKDSYHASLLHLFFTTFEINRINQSGGIIVDSSGGNHVSYSKIDEVTTNADYKSQSLRSSKENFNLEDPVLLDGVDEIGDGITLQILSVFPGFVLQQVRNSLAIRQILPRGTTKTELVWTYIGYADDDPEMTERRLIQANLVGPAGFISMEDGAIGAFVQRGIKGVEEDNGVVMMGGHTAESVPYRATETSVRGFWKKYRTLIEGQAPNA